jgi:hypothetical protein
MLRVGLGNYYISVFAIFAPLREKSSAQRRKDRKELQ